MTFEEIKQVLEKEEISVEEFAQGDYGESKVKPDGSKNWYIRIHPLLGEVERIEHYGGEDKGSTYFDVWHVKNSNVYIRVDAYYSSYEGADYDDSELVEVTPTQKIITVYE